MNCETARRMMETNDPALAQHLASCPSCIVRTHARYYDAPAGLDEHIRRRVRKDGANALPWRWIAIAAGVLLAVSLGWNFAQFRGRIQVTEDAVLSAHIRSLEGTHLVDVPSSDQHTVKPWFNGKVDFAPPVKDVEGFPLLGGRLEYFEGHPAAALVYGRRGHTINVFIWPSAALAEGSSARNGYHVERWSGGGMTFWAVSDLNEAELRQFVSLYRRN